MSSKITDLAAGEFSDLLWPAQFVVELALGALKPKEVCEHYGYDKQAFTALLKNPTFVAMLDEKRRMLLEPGAATLVKAEMILDAAVDRMATIVADDELPLGAVVEIGKFCDGIIRAYNAAKAKVAAAAGGPVGPSASITIHVGNKEVTMTAGDGVMSAGGDVIDVTPSEVADSRTTITISAPPAPAQPTDEDDE